MVAVREVRRHILEVRAHEGLQDCLILGHCQGEVGVLVLRLDLGQRLCIPNAQYQSAGVEQTSYSYGLHRKMVSASEKLTQLQHKVHQLQICQCGQRR